MPRVFAVFLLLQTLTVSAMEPQRKPQDEPLLDWSLWQKHRASVAHPAAMIKPADLVRARANLERYEWAQRFRDGLERGVKDWPEKLTPEFLASMIPATTPGDTLFTPCPACRDLGKPAHPHGQWKWAYLDPEKLTCVVCGTVFPNEKYPESIVLRAAYGGGQTFSYCGGEPFRIFSYIGRPSFTGAIRAHKVNFMLGLCRRLAEAFALTGKTDYARATRSILLRFAEAYPNWLVHVGYGEYADMHPHIAALNINSLPQDELCPPPANPDRRLHTGYWSAGRARGVGMEAGFVRDVVEAYEFTCEARDGDKPLYAEADRLKIEKDLLLESTVLLVSDKQVNNKSVGNAAAVALVGMSLGHPEMVRFGLDVFMKTVDGWFLPDGGTSESWSYANMTLGGIEALGQAFRGYTDPPGYLDAAGKRIENLNLYRDTAYKKVWAAMFNGLQGDLLYPPLADGHRSSGMGSQFAELMAVNYPETPQYLALLKALAGDDLARGYSRYALYYREPDFEKKPSPPLAFPDYVFPDLQIGHLRSGPHGRDSLLVLSASDWGGHHHLDSLSLYYWQSKRELLSDLGYLWDHPMSAMTRRTFAHNTVMVDGAEQITKGRGGKFTLFNVSADNVSGGIKVMEAESQAYSQCSLYRRTVAQVEHPSGRRYVADIFRVRGGGRHEYVFHGPNNDVHIQGPALRNWKDQGQQVRFCIRFHVAHAGSEIYLCDLSIEGPDGRNIMPNPSAASLDPQTGKPQSWGYYQGDGKGDWGRSEQGPEGGHCVFLKALTPGAQLVNVALIAGDADGYTGPRAFVGELGATYKVRFRIRGKAPALTVNVLYWPDDPSSAANRSYTEVKDLTTIAPRAEWTAYAGEFTLPSPVHLENVRSSEEAVPCALTWKMDDEVSFAAHWTGVQGETFLLGDGWGQRDYRNSDVGATLPYIIRRRPASDRPTVFVSLFEGFAPGKAIVKALKPIDVPSAESDNTVAFAVETDAGADYLVSCLEPRPVKLETSAGPLEMTGRFAVVSVRDGKLAAAALIEGTRLCWLGQDITAQPPGKE